jgi:hypothetical protein
VNNAVKMILIYTLFLAGCAINLPISNSMSEFKPAEGKAAPEINVSYTCKTQFKDGKIVPMRSNEEDYVSGIVFEHNESEILTNMLNKYMSSKYRLDETESENKITIILKDFRLIQYSKDSADMEFVKLYLGRALDMQSIAKIMLQVQIKNNGNTSKENFIITSQSPASNYFIGEAHTENIDKMNAEVLEKIDDYLTDNFDNAE